MHLDNLNRILPKGEALPVPMLSRVTFGTPLRSAVERAEGTVPGARAVGGAAVSETVA